MSTELVRTFIENFYDEQKKYLILYGFIPFLIYLVATIDYLTTTRERLNQQDFYEFELNFMNYVGIIIMILGTVYFTRNEIVQMKTLRS